MIKTLALSMSKISTEETKEFYLFIALKPMMLLSPTGEAMMNYLWSKLLKYESFFFFSCDFTANSEESF
jgi:hypothetical protein